MYVYVAFDLKNIIMFDKESLQDIHNYIYFSKNYFIPWYKYCKLNEYKFEMGDILRLFQKFH